jgi:hypothetical protein
MKLIRLFVTLPLLLLWAMPAQAQQPAPEPAGSLSGTLTGSAKAEYDAGRILFGDSDFAGAVVKFERALDQSGDLRLLWNMAVCEKNLRHYVQVLRLLERYRREYGSHLSRTQWVEVASVVDTVRTLISEVQLRVVPDGAEVFLDGVSQGTSPLPERMLVDLGTRRIRVSKPGYEDWQVTREFVGRSSVVMSTTLHALPQEARLTIVCDGDAAVRIDGKLVGQGQFSGVLLAGNHQLQITESGKVPYARDLTLQVGESRTLQVTLQERSSGLAPLLWIGAGVLVAGGAAAGVYVLTHSDAGPKATQGTLPPGLITVAN